MTTIILLGLAVACWLWSHNTIDRLVAWCRFILSVFLLFLALTYAVVDVAQWVMA